MNMLATVCGGSKNHSMPEVACEEDEDMLKSSYLQCFEMVVQTHPWLIKSPQTPKLAKKKNLLLTVIQEKKLPKTRFQLF